MVDATLKDQIRVFCGLEAPANYFLNRADRARDFRSSPPLYQVAAHWAVARGNHALYQQVADGFARIPAAERRRIEDKWVGAYVDSSIPPYLRYSGYGLLALATLLLIMTLWSRTLSRRVAERSAALEQAQLGLKARIKEQDCLYGITRASDDLERPLDELLQEVAGLLPQGFSRPELAARA